jgi:hypothetical protein
MTEDSAAMPAPAKISQRPDGDDLGGADERHQLDLGRELAATRGTEA